MDFFTDANLASRRDLLFATAGGLALALAHPARAAQNTTSVEAPMASAVPYVEHRIAHGGHMIYAREYPGQDPTFVLMHGFPDNLHIYDYLVPYLTRAGRRVVMFDFLGFGQSEKVSAEGYQYTFKQQVGDVAAVVDALKIDKFVPVGHDSGGPCAANYALDNPDRVAWLCLLNCYYSDSPTWRLPEIIEVFGDPWLRELAQAFLSNPDKMNWLITFQDNHFQVNMPPNLRERFVGIVRPIVDGNFAGGAGPAFSQMTSQVRESVAYNTSRLPDVRRFSPKVNLIWGAMDPYLTSATAAAIAANYPHSEVKSIEAGHWLMIDKPAEVARLLLTAA
ncbi:alpha/beta hydrolase [Bradyrhizobium manausense]|uniref:alpha/beta fold hydrolase n=1 Tax=Bradyrhizobium TaxID=374 RepID=UPI001BA4A774|nr:MULTISPECIES: alpha/beta hydrolase [Bradyrhizobium]MBR0828074.1 alpha/beta hydrolase [Bradyrhizobium manausense]UVO32934.1 alpha/beta hydrolase [Bradyrhizobium arachidis]